MKYFIPKNKKTGQQYPAITEALKTAWEADPALKGKYVFLPVADAVTEPGVEAQKPVKAKKEKAPEPVEARRAEDSPKTEQE